MPIHPDQVRLSEIKIRTTYTCPASINVGDPVYRTPTGVDLADCSDSTKMPAIGIVETKQTLTTCVVVSYGNVFNLGWGLFPRETYYVGPGTGIVIEGALPVVAGTIKQKIGFGDTSDSLIAQVDRDFSIVGEEDTIGVVYTCPVTVNVRDVVYQTGTDSVDKADCTGPVAKGPSVGVVAHKPTNTTCFVVQQGVVSGFAPGTFTPMQTLFMGASANLVPAGSLPAIAGTIIQELGYAKSGTEVMVTLDRDYVVL